MITKFGNHYSDGMMSHNQSLIELIKPDNLTLIDERPRDLSSMIIEPMYFKNGVEEQYKCPDLFLGYNNGLWSVIELKHSVNSRDKAYEQIESGFKMLVDIFGIDSNKLSGKMVTYKNGFEYEMLNSHY